MTEQINASFILDEQRMMNVLTIELLNNERTFTVDICPSDTRFKILAASLRRSGDQSDNIKMEMLDILILKSVRKLKNPPSVVNITYNLDNKITSTSSYQFN